MTEDGTVCSFRGTYLEVEPPIRTVETWLFNGWPDAEAVETMELHETDGVTTFTWRLAFRDKAGRDHMTRFDGQQDSLDEMEDPQVTRRSRRNCLWVAGDACGGLDRPAGHRVGGPARCVARALSGSRLTGMRSGRKRSTPPYAPRDAGGQGRAA